MFSMFYENQFVLFLSETLFSCNPSSDCFVLSIYHPLTTCGNVIVSFLTCVEI